MSSDIGIRTGRGIVDVFRVRKRFDIFRRDNVNIFSDITLISSDAKIVLISSETDIALISSSETRGSVELFREIKPMS